MTLYEIDEEILNLVDQETGEVIDTDRLEELQMERDKKVSNVACWIKNLKAEAEALKAEKENLAKRQQSCERKAEQLKDYLAYALNGTKYKDARVSVSYRKSESVEVDDMAIFTLPEEYIKVEKSVKKTELKNAMKLGLQFDGCRLVEKNNIQIR